MCIICLEHEKHLEDLDYIKELLASARREMGSIDPAHLKDIEDTVTWLEEPIE